MKIDSIHEGTRRSAVSAIKMRALLCFASAILALAAISAVFPQAGELAVYDGMVRLHVIANSDSDADQALKLEVRDAILRELESEMLSAESASEAAELLGGMTGRLAELAEKTAADAGAPCSAAVELGQESYPTRAYDGVTLPAGSYLSLRVRLGSAEGKNWWCVLFPPLCLDSSRAREELSEAGFTTGQIRFLCESDAPRYVLKFRFLEILSELFGRFR